VDSLDEFRKYNTKEEERVNINGVSLIHRSTTDWKPPLLGVVMVNWDASLNVKKHCIGIGIVARDHNGIFLGARAVTKIVVGAPKVAEAMTAVEAVPFCTEVGFFEVLLEGDAKQVVTEVNVAGPNLSAVGQFVTGIQVELQGLRHTTMVYVGKESNNVLSEKMFYFDPMDL